MSGLKGIHNRDRNDRPRRGEAEGEFRFFSKTCADRLGLAKIQMHNRLLAIKLCISALNARIIRERNAQPNSLLGTITSLHLGTETQSELDLTPSQHSVWKTRAKRTEKISIGYMLTLLLLYWYL